jgi:NDP-sugar pyrophosphorylase family protein
MTGPDRSADGAGRGLAVVVLAAGAGTRLRPLTDHRPKALCPVGNVPLLDRALALVARLGRTGPTEVAVNAWYKAEDVAAHVGRRAHLSVEGPQALGTAGAIGLLRDWIDGRDVLAINSDAYLNGSIAPLLDGWCGDRVRLLTVHDPGRGDFGPLRFAAASLLPAAMAATLTARPAGLYEAVWRSEYQAGRVDMVIHHGAFIDCGTPADYLAANLHAAGGAALIARTAQVTGAAEPPAVVGDRAVVEGAITRAVVWPEGRVGPAECLVDAVRIGADITVECAARC